MHAFLALNPVLRPTWRNEFISLLINSIHALRRGQKDRFNTEKHQKGRKKAPVRGRLPRKQGLKLDPGIPPTDSATHCPRATSTKTRIETFAQLGDQLLDMCPRATSTKTRIETHRRALNNLQAPVRGRLPRKQGLKRY